MAKRLALAALLLLLAVATARAQNFGSPLSFTFDWDVTSSDGRAAISGHVHNNTVWKVMKVRVAVEVLDASGATIAKASAWVPGEINEGGRAFFSVPLPERGAGYRLSVESFEFLEKGRG